MKIAPHILAHGNWLSMEDFMELALYDEESGYYATHIADVGVRGDFSTSATLSDLPARRLVALWRETCRACGRFLPFLEVGGGNGDMAMAVSRSLGFWERLRARYLMVDRSERLRQVQRLVGGGFVRVYDTIQSALKACGGRAFIFSNELPDAFPARQFVFQGGQWLELGWACEGGRIFRQASPVESLPQSAAFDTWAQEGQVVEVQESYHRWYAAWQPLWKCGACVTIDYGEPNDTLYYRRPSGTLRGYKSHTLLSVDELPALAGHCDVTADVNFTDLMNLAARCGGDELTLLTQREFLLPLADTSKPEEAHLVAVPGAGDHFRVLIQQRREE